MSKNNNLYNFVRSGDGKYYRSVTDINQKLLPMGPLFATPRPACVYVAGQTAGVAPTSTSY